MSILKTEITTDPLARGYSTMSDQQVADSLNTANRTVLRTLVPSYEVFEAIVWSEYEALTAAAKVRIDRVLALTNIDPRGANTQGAMQAFAAGTATRTALLALRNQTVSRAQELGIGRVKPGHVAAARA